MFGYKFLFKFRPDGMVWYANNSNYKNTMIRKEVFLIPTILRECRRGNRKNYSFLFPDFLDG